MKTKRIIAAILSLVLVFSFAACGKKKANVDDVKPNDNQQQVEENNETTSRNESDKPQEVEKPQDNASVSEDKKQETKPSKEPATTPQAKPEQKPAEKPTEKPAEKPAETPKTVGTTLLADFKAKAGSGSALSIAESIISNPIIPFMGASMPVEPGLLSGFGNTEIKGFSEGATFGPMIGSIPFIGYVFVLSDGTNVSEFISTLKTNADLRWNICVEADEMVVGSSGNKVFFVMCPKEFNGGE